MGYAAAVDFGLGLCIISVITQCFAVGIVLILSDQINLCGDARHNFGFVGDAMVTCLQVLTSGAWQPVADSLVEVSSAAWLVTT